MNKKKVLEKLMALMTNGYEIAVHDPHIFLWRKEGGSTSIWKEGAYYRVFSQGPGWSDQAASTWDEKEVRRYLWEIPVRFLREARVTPLLRPPGISYPGKLA